MKGIKKQKQARSGKPKTDKKYISLYLPKELIKKIRIEAIETTDSGLPSHFVERVLADYFENR